MRACVNWVALRLAFVLGFALFVLAMFDRLPKIFLLIGFGLYCIAVPIWLYPQERMYPREELAPMAEWDAADLADERTSGDDAASPTTSDANAIKAPKGPEPVPSAGHPTRDARRLQVPLIAMVAAHVVPHRWRKGSR